MTIPEPHNKEFAIWFQGSVPWTVMVRIDDYEEDEAPGERWFCADQHFTDSDRNSYGYTWSQVLEMFSHLDGPWLTDGLYRHPGAHKERLARDGN